MAECRTDVRMNQDDYEGVVETNKKILELELNTVVQYNLGSLYAQGKGVGQSFLDGAYWFHQVGLSGDGQVHYGFFLKATVGVIPSGRIFVSDKGKII